jgi:hypothetical protein
VNALINTRDQWHEIAVEALTTDEHFQQAGFHALLLPPLAG